MCQHSLSCFSEQLDSIYLFSLGERPFKCALCGRGFKQSSDMKKHRKTHFKTSNTNGNSKTIHFNNNEFVQEYGNKFAGIIKANSPFLNMGPENLPGNYDNNPSDEQPSPNVDPSIGNVNETINQIIKVEMKSSCEGVVSPLSCDSGVKVESDHSASPENITREKKIRYNNEPPLQGSAAMDMPTSARMPARYYAYGNLSNGHNFQEQGPTPTSVLSFYQPVPGNKYQFQNTSEKSPGDDFQEKQMYAGAYPLNAQFVENGLRHSVTMEIQNGEIPITEHENRKRLRTESDDGHPEMVHPEMVRPEQGSFSNFYQMENSDVTVVTQRNPGQGIEKDITQDQGRNPGDTNTQNGILPMNVVETAATHEGMDVRRPSEDAVDEAEVAGRVSKSGIVRKPVVVKLRTEKESGTFKRTEMSSARKLGKTKRGNLKCCC